MLRNAVRLILLGLIATLAPTSAHTQSWPTRPVTMVVPFAAGGPMDTVGRILAPRLGEVLGQQVVIENVGGAGGMPARPASPKLRRTAINSCLAMSARTR